MILQWILIFIFDCIKYLLGLHIIFSIYIHKKRMQYLIPGALCYIFLLAARVFKDETPILFSVLIVLFLMYIILNDTRKNKIVIVLKCAYIIICTDEIISRLFESVIVNLNDKIVIPTRIFYLLCNSIDIVILVIIYFVKKRKEKNKYPLFEYAKKIMYFISVFIVFIILLSVSGFSIAYEYINNPLFIKMANIASIVSLIGMLGFGIWIIYVSNLNKIIQDKLVIETFLKKAQEDYYKAMLEKEEDTRSFRHDIENHLLCINELLKKEDIEGLKLYISNMKEQAETINKKIFSLGNEIIDITMNYYFSKLINTEIRIFGYIYREIKMNSVDVCSVFSNIFKNITEEFEYKDQMLSKKQYVHIEVFNGNDNLKISIINSMQSKILRDLQGKIKTKKTDLHRHGFGLKNIDNIIRKNHGLCRYEVMENEFLIEIVLPIKKDH